ncbi:MAG: hypothetical protein ACE361_12385 [Aureliella sp.]
MDLVRLLHTEQDTFNESDVISPSCSKLGSEKELEQAVDSCFKRAIYVEWEINRGPTIITRFDNSLHSNIESNLL